MFDSLINNLSIKNRCKHEYLRKKILGYENLRIFLNSRPMLHLEGLGFYLFYKGSNFDFTTENFYKKYFEIDISVCYLIFLIYVKNLGCNLTSIEANKFF